MKKGFTLIELLAVIVILALIALIATPLIINVIDQARKGAFKDSVHGIIKSAELDYAKAIYNDNNIAVTYTYENGVESANVEGRYLPYKGDKPQSGSVVVNSEGQISLALHDGNYCAEKGFDDIDVVISDKSVADCKLKPIISQFTKNFGSSATDRFYSVDKVIDGYVISSYASVNDGDFTDLAIEPDDAIFVKYDNNGNLLFKKKFGGSKGETFQNVVGTNDGYIAVGSSSSNDGDLLGMNNGNGDAIIVKYNTTGNVVWKKNYGGTIGDTFKSVAVADDGYIAVGYSNSTDIDLAGLNKGVIDGIIVKYDINGNLLWKKNFGGTQYDYFENVIVIADGYLVSGQGGSADGDLSGLNNGNSDAVLVKYDLDGNIIWKKNFGGTGSDYYISAAKTNDGYIVIGRSNSNNIDLNGVNQGGYDAFIVKYDTSGNVIWSKDYGGSAGDGFYGISVINDGYIAAGYSDSTDGDLARLNKGGADGVIIKYDVNGNVVWSKNYGGSGSDYINDIVVTTTGYSIVGYSDSTDMDFSGITSKGGYDAFISYQNY